MVTNFISNKKATPIIPVETQFKIGDIVKVINFGQVYPTYLHAYRLFSKIHQFINLRLDSAGRFCSLDIDSKKTEKMLKNRAWIVIGKCLHAYGSRVLYLIFNPSTNYGLIIEENGIILQKRNIHHIDETKLKFYQAL